MPAVLHAGRLEMAHFSAGVRVERKADKSPVSVADREAEDVLVTALQTIAPAIPVIAEEAASEGRLPSHAERLFLVDALDGTRQFVRGNPEFSINIALVDHGRPVFGLIYGPSSGRLFLTGADTVAYQAVVATDANVAAFNDLALTPLATRPPDLAALVAFNSISAGSSSAPILHALSVKEARPFGSALKFGLIAAGEGDLYARIGETYEWDTAAGQAILEAAGGMVAGLDGRPLTYGHVGRGYLNPHFIAWGRRPLLNTDQTARALRPSS